MFPPSKTTARELLVLKERQKACAKRLHRTEIAFN
jgi:hypothetical protein